MLGSAGTPGSQQGNGYGGAGGNGSGAQGGGLYLSGGTVQLSNDTLSGNNGDDYLEGGPGNDSLTHPIDGGPGDGDICVYDATDSAPPTVNCEL